MGGMCRTDTENSLCTKKKLVMQDIHINQIMQEIRTGIASKGYKATSLKFSQIRECDDGAFSRVELLKSLATANGTCHIDINSPILGRNRCKRFVKRIVRKIVRPVLEQQVSGQELYNVNVFRSLRQLENYIQELEARVSELERRPV